METKTKIEPRYFSYEQASAYSSLSRWTLYRAIEAGELPAVRVGRRTLIERAALDQFLEARTISKTERRKPADQGGQGEMR